MAALDMAAFDFWIGEWDAEFDGGHAVNTVQREFEGKVLVERFVVDRPRTWHGMSVSAFDAANDRWQQTWVDDSGQYWHFVGELVDGDPTFATPAPVDDPPRWKRMVFTDITDDSLQWRWESSPDRETWTENWAISYTRRS